VIDLLAPSSEFAFHLSKIAIRRDGTNTNALLAEIDLSAPIETEEEALVLDGLVPGASSLWRRSSEGAEDAARFGRTPSSMSVHARLALLNRAEDEVVFARTVAVARALVAVSARARSFVLRLRVGGLDPREVAMLCGALDERVSLSTSSVQLTLFAGATVSVPAREIREVASIRVTDGGLIEYRFGSVTDETDLSISLRDLHEQEPECFDRRTVEVVSRLRVEAPEKLLRSYRKLADMRGLVPSWGDLIVAVGRDYGEGGSSAPGNVWTLRRDHVVEALGGIDLALLDDESVA
jgi:hypothetical protein